MADSINTELLLSDFSCAIMLEFEEDFFAVEKIQQSKLQREDDQRADNSSGHFRKMHQLK